MTLSRGAFIGTSLGLALLPRRTAAADGQPNQLAPVNVDPRRIIRTVAGLRPYRASGFVLRAESLQDKVLVHDYGHGGGGFTLSWGCATLAADFVNGRSPSQAAVVGSGVIGLTTARILQDRGWNVTIYTAAVPPQTTSNVAGAQWFPSAVFSRSHATPAFLETLRNVCRLANRAFQSMVGSTYGVRWLDNYTLKASKDDDDELDLAQYAGIGDLEADIETLDPATLPFRGIVTAKRFTTMMIEPNTFLPAIERDFYVRGGRTVVREFHAAQEFAQLLEPVVFNCTGLGSRSLLGDKELEPARGQLTILEPQPEVNYCYLLASPIVYMFPRSDGIVLGGTFERGNWSTDIDLAAQTRILAAHRQLIGG
jgi:D-amino-acid oxidase